MFFDKFYVNLTSQGTGIWKVGSDGSTKHNLMEGLTRIEFHSLTNGTSFSPPIFHDDIVVTDEAGQIYP